MNQEKQADGGMLGVNPIEPLRPGEVLMSPAMADKLRGSGVGQDAESQLATWMIDVQKDGVHLRRMHNGVPCESYGVVSPAVAAIWVAAIIQGYQPPRDLRRLDSTVGCEECGGTGEIRRPYSSVERMPCPICTSRHS